MTIFAHIVPKRIVSDRESCFTSSKFTTVIKEFDIQHILVAVTTPRTNGQAERINRFNVPMIAKTTTNIHKWIETFQLVKYAVNNTVYRSTNSTPSKLLFGVNQNYKCNNNIRDTLETLSMDERNFPSTRKQASDAIKTLQNENIEAEKQQKAENAYSVRGKRLRNDS